MRMIILGSPGIVYIIVPKTNGSDFTQLLRNMLCSALNTTSLEASVHPIWAIDLNAARVVMREFGGCGDDG